MLLVLICADGDGDGDAAGGLLEVSLEASWRSIRTSLGGILEVDLEPSWSSLEVELAVAWRSTWSSKLILVINQSR